MFFDFSNNFSSNYFCCKCFLLNKINFNIYNFPESFVFLLLVSAGYFFMRWFGNDFGVISSGSVPFFSLILLLSSSLLFIFFLSFKSDLVLSLVSLIIIITYSYNVAYTINIILDGSVPTLERPLILNKFKVTGSKTSGDYFIIASWGKGNLQYRVDPGEYGRHKIGESLCVKKYPGYLSVNWYSINEFCS